VPPLVTLRVTVLPTMFVTLAGWLVMVGGRPPPRYGDEKVGV